MSDYQYSLLGVIGFCALLVVWEAIKAFGEWVSQLIYSWPHR